MSHFDLSGKFALVTGGSRGLGKAIAQRFAQHGATVIVASRKEEACVETAREISSSTGQRALGLRLHVGRWDDCDRAVADVYKAFGAVDVLVNCAGMSPQYSSLTEVSEELFDKVFAVNVKGAFRLATTIGTRMQARGGGSIINVGSTASIHPGADELPYAMAKAGINVLTAGLARALSPQVRVNTIMAGPFLTDISKSWNADVRARISSSIPMGRAGNPDEICGAALYLASDAASYTTGAVLRVDGGLTSSLG